MPNNQYHRLYSNFTQMVKHVLVLSIVFLASAAYIGLPTLAQETPTEAGLSISPLVFELNADPGDSLTNHVKIYNPTANPINVDMLVEDFAPVGEEGQVILSEPDPDNATYSLAFWTSITPKTFVLEPKKEQIVDFVINLPAGAEPGGHYGSIVASISGGSQSGSGSIVGSKRGALVLLRVSGNIREDLTIDTFFTDNFQEKGPVSFALKFQNNGNVHVRPAGFITITDTFGKQVAQIEIEQKNVIPDSVRDITTEWDNKKLFGRYTATLVANYGNESKQVVTAVTSFTVFPWKIGLAVLAILSIIIWVIVTYKQRIKLAARVLLGKHK